MPFILKIPPYTLIFGDSSIGFPPNALSHLKTEDGLLEAAPYGEIIQQFGAKHIAILKQIHSAHGFAVSHDALIPPYTHEGDFLVTNESNIALLTATADCAPVIIIDKERAALAVIHAGWRGAADAIIAEAIALLIKKYHSSPSSLQLIVGPTARSCCYEVQDDFPLWGAPGSTAHAEKKFFDLPTYITKQSISAGISEDSIDISHAICTICSPLYCSFRRDKENACRQITCGMIG